MLESTSASEQEILVVQCELSIEVVVVYTSEAAEATVQV